MATEEKTLLAFNRGVISPRGLARVDLDRMAMSAETQTNFPPRVLGSMMLRPGMEYIGNSYINFECRNLGFSFGVDDTALIELSNANMRVRVDDVLITYPAVTTTIDNPLFATSVPDANWTDESDMGGTATYASGFAQVFGDGTDFGRYEQDVTVSGGDIGLEHCVRFTITDGPLLVRIGSTSGDDDYIEEARLDSGLHHLAFTPTGNFFIQFSNEREFIAWVDAVEIFTGDLRIATPWSTTMLPFLRWDQSGDVIYVACKATSAQTFNATVLKKIERREDGRSWSVADYRPEDGPFRVQNVSGVALDVSALFGDVTLHASQPIFKSNHAADRSLWRIASAGQTVTETTSADNGDFTTSIRVVGSDAARIFLVVVEGTFVGTVTLEFSFDDTNWNDTGQTYTSPTSVNYDDGQDGQIIYYRLICKSGDFTSGTITMTLVYAGGSIQGVCRARVFTDSQNMSAQVLKDFGSIAASRDWWEGEWSKHRGRPTAVNLHEGRLWWAGLDKIWGSISDAYQSFDDNQVGDSAPISRTIGQGPIKVIHWLLSMGRLLMGTSDNAANVAAVKTDGNSPLGARSSSFDEPLTVTNFSIKNVDSKGVFVGRDAQRLYEMAYDGGAQDYKPIDLSIFAPDFNINGIRQIAVQIKPDLRIHCVRNDGTVGMLVYDRAENVIAWVEINCISSTNGTEKVIDVAVLPGVEEDQVYYTITREQSPTEVHIMKWAKESEAIGGTVNKMLDDFVHYSGAPTTTITGLDHLDGETVSVWRDGIHDPSTYVPSSGSITLTVAASEAVVGMDYKGQYKSAKLGDIVGIGLLERKMVQRIGFIAQNMHWQGLQYGPDFDNLYDLPQVEQGDVIAADTVHAEYHEDNFAFGGEWKTDSRICLQAVAPRPVTILAAIADIRSLEKISSDRRTKASRS